MIPCGMALPMARPCPSRPGWGVRSWPRWVRPCRVLGSGVPEFVVRHWGFGRWCRRSFARLSGILGRGSVPRAVGCLWPPHVCTKEPTPVRKGANAAKTTADAPGLGPSTPR